MHNTSKVSGPQKWENEEARQEREREEIIERRQQEAVKALDIYNIEDFSQIKGKFNYWDDAVRDFWAETGEETDEIELRIIIKWFDERRKKIKAQREQHDK